MKICPICQTIYADESLRFCLQDGTGLREYSEVAPTQDWSEKETVVRQKPVTTDWEPVRKTADATLAPEPKASRTLLTIIVTIAAMSLLFGGIIIGWFVLKDDGSKNKVVTGISPTKKTSRTPTPTKTNERNQNDNTGGAAEWTMDYNSGLNGERITYYRGTTVEACQADCADNPKCAGFTLIRAGAYNPQDPPMCYLMSKVTGPAPSSCCISGVKAGGKTDGPQPPQD